MVATLNPEYQENSLRFPRFLPDGRHFLYVRREAGGPAEVPRTSARFDGAKPTRLLLWLIMSSMPRRATSLYVQAYLLVARAFDLDPT